MSNSRTQAGVKLRDDEKVKYIPVTIVPTEKEEMLRKPEWIKIKLPRTTDRIDNIKKVLRENNLHSVCEEASCPNLAECFNHGTATFMILGIFALVVVHFVMWHMESPYRQVLKNPKSWPRRLLKWI